MRERVLWLLQATRVLAAATGPEHKSHAGDKPVPSTGGGGGSGGDEYIRALLLLALCITPALQGVLFGGWADEDVRQVPPLKPLQQQAFLICKV